MQTKTELKKELRRVYSEFKKIQKGNQLQETSSAGEWAARLEGAYLRCLNIANGVILSRVRIRR